MKRGTERGLWRSAEGTTACLGALPSPAVRHAGRRVRSGANVSFYRQLHRVAPPIDERVHGFAEVGAALKALPEGQHFGQICVRFPA